MSQLLNIQPGWALLLVGIIALAVVGVFLLLNARTMIPRQPALAPIMVEMPSYGQSLTALPISYPPVFSTAFDNPPLLSVEPPRCYDTPSRQLLCMGQIYNPSSQPVASVSVTLAAQTQGAAIKPQTAHIALEGRYIPPHSYAPYHARFDLLYEETTQVLAQFASHLPSRKKAYELEILDERSEFVLDTAQNASYGRYVITAKVRNPYTHAISSVQVISSLTDRAGYLAGYRVQELKGGIQVGETIPIRLEITPMVIQSGFKYSLSVLAWDNEVGD